MMASPTQSNSQKAPHDKLDRTLGTTLAQTPADPVAQLWLDAQCDMLAGTQLGFVFRPHYSNGLLTPSAHWPNNLTQVPNYVLEAANNAKDKSTLIFISTDGGQICGKPKTCIVATPMNDSDSGGDVAVFELPYSIRHQQQAAIQLLQWGAVWFNLLKRRQPATLDDDRLKTVLELLATCLEHGDLASAATAAVTELAVKLSCTRVSLGIKNDDVISVFAVSNCSRIDQRLNLTRSIGAAMNEAVDQAATLTWPQNTEDLPRVTRAQAILAKISHQGGSVLSTPLYNGREIIGALTLERDEGPRFDKRGRATSEALSALLGPVIALKQYKEKPLFSKFLDSATEFAAQFFGCKRFDLKFYALFLVITVAFLSMAEGNYRVTSQARLEGSIKRVVTAPLSGFIASAERRAGDVVNDGELLAQLDDQDLRLQKVQLLSQIEELGKEQRSAFSGHDRSAAAIITARKQQIDAQLSLVEHQLERTRLTAPLQGIIVSGDLSQQIGSPVENGQVLFEISPLENYRVVLEVDERDIGSIKEAQRGKLTLTGLPGTLLYFNVSRIIPLSTARDGRNFFEVQAELENPHESLRPGMEGIGKIDIDERKLIWVWTHELTDWLRLSLWRWLW